MTMPCHWGDGGLAGFRGRVRLGRRFGYPGRIDSYERVWLTFAGVEGEAAAWLNGQALGRCGSGAEFDVTAMLKERNELVVEVESASDRGGLWGEVALEVRRTAYLKNVEVTRGGGAGSTLLEFRGLVVGTADQPLELYALVGRHTVAYAVTQAAPDGHPFLLQAVIDRRPDDGGPVPVRVDLVAGATIWYSVERTV